MRCNHYNGRERCPDDAEYLLYDHENLPIPGGLYWAKHLTEIISEYAEKLGERWRGIAGRWIRVRNQTLRVGFIEENQPGLRRH